MPRQNHPTKARALVGDTMSRLPLAPKVARCSALRFSAAPTLFFAECV